MFTIKGAKEKNLATFAVFAVNFVFQRKYITQASPPIVTKSPRQSDNPNGGKKLGSARPAKRLH